MAGFRWKPETQSFDSNFEQSWRQPLRKDISFVERRLLVHDPTVIRGKRLANDAHGNPFDSLQVARSRRISRLDSRDALSVIFTALKRDISTQRLAEQAEQRKCFRFQGRRRADCRSLASRRRGVALSLRTLSDRPAAFGLFRLLSIQSPEVDFVVSRSPARSASGDIASTQLSLSHASRQPTCSRSA